MKWKRNAFFLPWPLLVPLFSIKHHADHICQDKSSWKHNKSLYTVALEGHHKPTRSLSSMQLMMPALYCRWSVTRWRLWTWPPYSGRTCCTSRRAQRRSSAWRARREWRTAPLSSAWCSSWSTRTSPCSRYVTHIDHQQKRLTNEDNRRSSQNEQWYASAVTRLS